LFSEKSVSEIIQDFVRVNSPENEERGGGGSHRDNIIILRSKGGIEVELTA
jgi:hypothetical protein